MELKEHAFILLRLKLIIVGRVLISPVLGDIGSWVGLS